MADKKKKKPKGFLRFLAFILIWLVPLAYIAYVTIDITTVTPITTEGGRRIVFSIWSLLIFGTLLITYVLRLRKKLSKTIEVSEIQGRPLPAFWRLVQLIEYAVSFGLLIGLVYVINALSDVLYTFGIVSLISGTIGYVLLFIDSVIREKYYQEQKLLEKIK